MSWISVAPTNGMAANSARRREFADAPSPGTLDAVEVDVLFAVLIGPAGDRAATEWSAEERREFLEALKSTRRLALEAAYGDDGSLLVLEAESMHDALALLHNDPYVIACGRVQMRPLVVNYVGRLEPESAGRDRAERERAGERVRRRSRARSPLTVLRGRKQNGSG